MIAVALSPLNIYSSLRFLHTHPSAFIDSGGHLTVAPIFPWLATRTDCSESHGNAAAFLTAKLMAGLKHQNSVGGSLHHPILLQTSVDSLQAAPVAMLIVEPLSIATRPVASTEQARDGYCEHIMVTSTSGGGQDTSECCPFSIQNSSCNNQSRLRSWRQICQ
jgi:hypothetical protein